MIRAVNRRRPELDVTRVNGGLVLRGELDLAGAERLYPILDDACQPGTDLAVNLHELEFIDSSGIRALLAAARRLGPGRLMLQGPHGMVARVLEVCGLERVENVVVTPDSRS